MYMYMYSQCPGHHHHTFAHPFNDDPGVFVPGVDNVQDDLALPFINNVKLFFLLLISIDYSFVRSFQPC